MTADESTSPIARLTALAEVTRALIEVALSPDDVLETVIRRVAELVGDLSVLTLLSADGRWLTPAAIHHADPELALAARDVFARAPQPADAGVNGRVIQTGRPLRVSADSLDEMGELILPEHRPYLQRTPTYSLLAVPLRARGRILGALSVSRQTPDRPYTAADEQFLQDLADRAGLAIETARLYATEAATRAETELAAARLREVNEHLVVASLREQVLAEEAQAARQRSDFLAEASAILSSSLDYETRLTSLMRLAVPLLADWCAIDMVRDDRQIHRLGVVHADPAKAEVAEELRRRYPVLAPDARHTIVRVLRDGASWFDAAVGEPRFSGEARDPVHLDLLSRLGFASEMVVPMLAHGRALGTLTFVFGESGRRHTPADLALAEELAGRAALALDNARLYREIKASEERFRTLADAMPQLVWTADADGVVDYYNSRVAEYGGAVRSADGAWDWQPALHPDDVAPTLAAWQAAARAGQPYQFAHRLRMADGSFRWHLSRAVPAQSELGGEAKWFGTATDIHDLRQAEAERERLLDQITAAEARYRGLFEGSADAILVADDQRRYIDANPAAAVLLGYSRDELLRLGVEDVVARDPAETRAMFEDFRAAGRWSGEIDLRRADGTLAPVDVRAATLALPGGPIHISTLRDISERRALERMQTEFLSLVTHELKNPLTGVLSYAQLMRRRGAYSERGVEAIVKEGRRLERLIDDLLDVSRVEAGRLDLRRDWIDLTPLVRAAVEDAQTLTERHTLELTAPEEPIIGWFDRDRIGQVLQNLLLNAIKYSPDGGPIRVRLTPSSEEVEIEVADEGVGIEPEALPLLFGRFYRTEQATSRHLPGLGLGLFITRSLVEAHGGHIRAESAGPGRGSVFSIVLPCRPMAERQ